MDEIDFARLNRVLHARKIQRILQESLRGKEEALTKDEWAEVAELEELYRRRYS